MSCFVADGGLFDFDDGGAVVGEDLRAEGAGEDAGEVQDPCAVKGEVGCGGFERPGGGGGCGFGPLSDVRFDIL